MANNTQKARSSAKMNAPKTPRVKPVESYEVDRDFGPDGEFPYRKGKTKNATQEKQAKAVYDRGVKRASKRSIDTDIKGVEGNKGRVTRSGISSAGGTVKLTKESKDRIVKSHQYGKEEQEYWSDVAKNNRDRAAAKKRKAEDDAYNRKTRANARAKVKHK